MPNYKPMLACDWDEKKFRGPYMAQPKVDGVRGLKMDGQITGRTLKRFANIHVDQPLFADARYNGIDGELALAGQSTSSSLCRDTTSSLTRIVGQPDIVWHAFDYLTPETIDLPYIQRYQTLEALIKLHEGDPAFRALLVPYTMVETLEELLGVEERTIAMGYEGLILRDPQGRHKQGRCTAKENALLRIKRFVEEDAIVVSLQEAMQNNNEQVINELGHSERSTHQENMEAKGMVGALICHDVKTGRPIDVGPGALTHVERAMYWNTPSLIVGRTIKYKHFPHGRKDKPRFPTFVAIRAEADDLSAAKMLAVQDVPLVQPAQPELRPRNPNWPFPPNQL